MPLSIEIDIPEPRFAPVFESLICSLGKIDREAAAKLVRLSTYQFSRSFAQHHKISFREMRQAIKIGVAACLLQQSRLRISEIAYFVGYSGVREFRRVFTARAGQSPLQFRKNTSPNRLTRYVAGRCTMTMRHVRG